MERKGMLFQGLPCYISHTVSFLGEESVYQGGSRILYMEKREKECVDITYLILYALSHNVRCRGKIKSMKKEWRGYLASRAECSAYQHPGFWSSLKYEEYQSARILLGLLEDLRGRREGKAERAWVCLNYLILTGYPEEREMMKKKKQISGEEICSLEASWFSVPFSGISRICAVLILAEIQGIGVVRDRQYTLLWRCAKQSGILWQVQSLE